MRVWDHVSRPSEMSDSPWTHFHTSGWPTETLPELDLSILLLGVISTCGEPRISSTLESSVLPLQLPVRCQLFAVHSCVIRIPRP